MLQFLGGFSSHQKLVTVWFSIAYFLIAGTLENYTFIKWFKGEGDNIS
jgi:hypothetical protein